MSTSGRAEIEGNAAGPKGPSITSLDQIREILFGSQHRELARKLARMDARFDAQAEELRSEMLRRLDLLEAHLRRETEALSASIDTQRAAQVEAINNLARESREAIGLMEQRVKQLEENMARAQ